MNRECRNCAHANLKHAASIEDPYVTCYGWDAHGEPRGFRTILDGTCGHFRPYTEKGEANPLDTLTVPREFAAKWFAKMAEDWRERIAAASKDLPMDADCPVMPHEFAGRCGAIEKRLKALEEDEGHARASRLLHGGEIMRAFDRICALEDRLGRLEKREDRHALRFGTQARNLKDRLDKLESLEQFQRDCRVRFNRDIVELAKRLDKLEGKPDPGPDVAIGSCRKRRDAGQ